MHFQSDYGVQFVKLLLLVALEIPNLTLGRIQSGINDALLLDQRLVIFLERFNGFQQICQNIFLIKAFFSQLTNLLVQCRIAARRAELLVLFIVKVIKVAEFVIVVLLLSRSSLLSALNFLLEDAKQLLGVLVSFRNDGLQLAEQLLGI